MSNYICPGTCNSSIPIEDVIDDLCLGVADDTLCLEGWVTCPYCERENYVVVYAGIHTVEVDTQ
jgi:hypothetical protein